MESYKPGAYWFSKISDAQKCLYLYKLKHIDKLAEPGAKSGDLEFGSAMHLGLNAVLVGEDGLGLFNTYWDSLKCDNSIEYGRYSYEILKANGETLIARFQRLHAKHIEVFKSEERIHAEIEGIQFEGTPDVLGSYKGIPSVIDFKTSAYRYDTKKIVSDSQMPFYAKLAEVQYGYEAKQLVYIVLIKDYHNPSIQIVLSELTNTIVHSTVDNVLMQCRELEARTQYPRNTSNCVRGTLICPFFEKCFGRKE